MLFIQGKSPILTNSTGSCPKSRDQASFLMNAFVSSAYCDKTYEPITSAR
jgi:hypothetical protein